MVQTNKNIMEEENILFETADNNNMELEDNIIEHDTID